MQEALSRDVTRQTNPPITPQSIAWPLEISCQSRPPNTLYRFWTLVPAPARVYAHSGTPAVYSQVIKPSAEFIASHCFVSFITRD